MVRKSHPKVNKRGLIRMVAAESREVTSLYAYEIGEVFDLFCQKIMDGMLSGNRVEIRNFGVFLPLIRVNYKGKMSSRVFKPSATLINKINRLKDMFEEYLSRSGDYE